MTLKRLLWLSAGVLLTTTGHPLVFNALDLIGWLMIGFTAYRMRDVIKSEFNLLISDLWNHRN